MAYIINGKVSEKFKENIEIQKKRTHNILEKFLSKIVKKDNFSVEEFSADSFEKIIKIEFLKYIKDKIKNPNESTKMIMSYLNSDRAKKMYVYLRKEKDFEYLQIGFKGCAGEAEISAELLSHWVEIWYFENRERIDDILINMGFLPNQNQEKLGQIFIPTKEAGYAIFIEEADLGDNELKTICFEFDNSMVEFMDEKSFVKLNKRIKEKYGKMMVDRKCKCQICDPDFIELELGK